jgi:sialic acid synthase SpsE
MAHHTPRDAHLVGEHEPGGRAVKRVLDIERDVRTASRQSLSTTRALPAGHTLTRADITFKRPGTGIPPFQLEETCRRRLARPIDADMPIMEQDLSPP